MFISLSKLETRFLPGWDLLIKSDLVSMPMPGNFAVAATFLPDLFFDEQWHLCYVTRERERRNGNTP